MMLSQVRTLRATLAEQRGVELGTVAVLCGGRYKPHTSSFNPMCPSFFFDLSV